jgi:hypothetical protein
MWARIKSACQKKGRPIRDYGAVDGLTILTAAMTP